MHSPEDSTNATLDAANLERILRISAGVRLQGVRGTAAPRRRGAGAERERPTLAAPFCPTLRPQRHHPPALP